MYVLGVDIGTTGTKSMLIDEGGTVVKTHYMAYPIVALSGGYIEQSPEEWWKAVAGTVRKCTDGLRDKAAVKAICLSTQGGSVVLCDERGEPISNAVSWLDTRGNEYIGRLLELKSEEFYYNTTGWKISPALPLSKLMWMREHRNSEFANSKIIFSTADYINFRLTGERVIDRTNGAMTQLMNIRTSDWDDVLLEIAQVKRSCLSRIAGAGEIVGKLTSKAAEELGLHREVLVVSGAHDQYAAAAGAGALASGDVVISTGTAWAILGISDRPLLNINNPISCGVHTVDGLFGSLATVAAAGAAFEWLRKRFAPARLVNGELAYDTYGEIDSRASGRLESTKNLFFMPYFTGKKFPLWNPAAKASILGLTLDNDFYDIVLVVMEGVVFDSRYILEGYEAASGNAKRLYLVGGASKSRLWTEILSDTLHKSIFRFEEANMACVGAGCIAGCGVGMFDSLETAAGRIAKWEEIAPENSERSQYYEEKYGRFLNGIKLLNSFYK